MREPKHPCVYIVASGHQGTLYTGVTSDIGTREWEHRMRAGEGFAREHRATRLVWFEHHDTMASAIQREKNIKRWYRTWKIALIEKTNPHWHQLDPETGQCVESGW